MKTGIQLITEERSRQITKEGWTSDHDDTHTGGEMAIAAACYALEDVVDFKIPINLQCSQKITHWLWTWSSCWWKPKDRICNLVRAGALIAAEIDRLQREEGRKSKS